MLQDDVFVLFFFTEVCFLSSLSSTFLSLDTLLTLLCENHIDDL